MMILERELIFTGDFDLRNVCVTSSYGDVCYGDDDGVSDDDGDS